MNQKNLAPKTEEEKEHSLVSLEVEKQIDKQSKSTYILKYMRKKNELTKLIQETNLPKEKHCLFMLDFILLKNNNNSESLLHINCHEVAAIHFEDFYERVYSFNDIIKENKYFKALDNVEEIKEIIDYTLSDNFKDSKKIFIKLENNSLYLHIMLTYFDTIKEIIFNIPKKNLNEEEKIALLPMILKEIQYKMIYYEKENKKYKSLMKVGIKNNFNYNFYEYYLKIEKDKEKENESQKEKEKEKEDENNKSCQQSIINETYDTSNNNSLSSEEKKNKKNKKTIKIKKKKKKRVHSNEMELETQNNEIKFENTYF